MYLIFYFLFVLFGLQTNRELQNNVHYSFDISVSDFTVAVDIGCHLVEVGRGIAHDVVDYSYNIRDVHCPVAIGVASLNNLLEESEGQVHDRS